jgi:Ca2+-binding EF-hand superfamily protein
MSVKAKKKPVATSSSKVKLNCEDVFNLLDFDQDGKIGTGELKDAILGCGIPADKYEIQTYIDLYNSQGGLIDLKTFRGICKELKPETKDINEFYAQQFKNLDLEQDGYVDLDKFKQMMKVMGQKISETNLAYFLRYVKKEENGKIKLQSIIEKLSALNILS